MLERELKLHVPVSQRRALEKEIRRLGASQASLAACYFDTPDRRLARAGIALRLRLEGGQWVQTVKAPGPDELSRLEINHPRPKPDLDLNLYGNTPVAAFFGGLEQPPEPTYETRVQRLVLRRDTGSGAVEFAYDRGAIIAGRFELPLCELELELVSGDAVQLFTLGAEWLKKYSLVLDLRSKAERGDGLARLARDTAGHTAAGAGRPAVQPGLLFPPRRARQIMLEPGMDLMQAYRQCVNECLNQIVRNAAFLAGVESEHPGPELCSGYVHQLRIGIRRLRSCWKLFGKWIPVGDSLLEGELRRYFALLGQSRDADNIRRHIEPRLMRAGMPALAPPGHAGRKEPDVDHADMRALAASVPFQSCLLNLLEHTLAISSPAPRLPAGAAGTEHAGASDPARLLRKRLNKWLDRICREGEHFCSLPVAEQHALRKRAKRLRYCLEFAAGLLSRKRMRRLQSALAEVQEELGWLNDLYVAQAHYTALAVAQPQALFALGWLQAMRDQSQAKAQEAFLKLRDAGGL